MAKFVQSNGLSVICSFLTWKGPGQPGAFLMLYLYYSYRLITHTPRRCAGLTRGFASLGLDRGFSGCNDLFWNDAAIRSTRILHSVQDDGEKQPLRARQ